MKFGSELISDIIREKNCENGKELISSKYSRIDEDIELEKYDILTDSESKFYKKPKGKYRLLSIKNPLELFDDEIERIEDALTKVLKSLFGKLNCRDKVLVVGLGNRRIVADSLGTAVCKRINITIEDFEFPKVMAVCPSVLGLTGIETYEIVKGIVDRVKPTKLILIDSLCAKDEQRLAKSIQVSNTGLCPGSGIGNNRKCLNNSLAKDVYSIGVPLLIFASTFITNTFEKNNIDYTRINSIMQNVKKQENSDEFIDFIKDIKNCINDDMDSIIVSLKDIEESVNILSRIISNSINKALGVFELK